MISVCVFESLGSSQTESCGESGEDGFGDDVGACDGVLEDFDVAIVLDVAGDVGRVALDFVSGDL